MPDIQKMITERVRDASQDAEHTLLYLEFAGLNQRRADALRRALEQLTGRLLGPVTMLPLGPVQVALLLEHWSEIRGRQLGTMLGFEIRRGLHAASGFRMRMGLVAFRGPADLVDLLAQAKKGCCPVFSSDACELPAWRRGAAGAPTLSARPPAAAPSFP